MTRLGIKQKIIAGKYIHHELDSFDKLPNAGDKVKVTYDKDNKAELVIVSRAEMIRQAQ